MAYKSTKANLDIIVKTANPWDSYLVYIFTVVYVVHNRPVKVVSAIIFHIKIRWSFGRKTRSRRSRRRRRRARRRRGGLPWGPGPVYGGVSLTDQGVPSLRRQLCNQMSQIKTSVHSSALLIFLLK
jgi:hypothetical protein